MSQQTRITREEVFDLLSNRRRRYALHACKREGTPIELRDLAEQIAAWEEDKSIEAITYDERRRVYTALQQSHIPAMEAAGVVTCDRNEIALTEQSRELDVYLDVVPKNSIPWAEYYLGLAAVSAGVLTSAWIDIYPFSVPDLAWGGLIVGAFLLSACAHVWQNRKMRIGNREIPPEIDQQW